MSFADYQLLVLQEYERKRTAGDLSRRMGRLTPAKFKEECEAVCSQRYDRKDEKTLEEFFGPGGDKVAWLKVIKQFDPDKFRPLVNFLKGKTRWPDEKNIELLAWLIDFKPRPHEMGRSYDTGNLDASAIKQDESGNDGDEYEEEAGPAEETLPSGGKKMPFPGNSASQVPGSGKRKAITAALMVAVAIAGVYWAWSKSSAVGMRASQACMYWTGDHYQQVRCSQKFGDTLLIPLDSEKLVHFRKITRPDTISENALGSIWYVKFHGAYECYTFPGYHPIDTALQLKLLTDYVLIKHIQPNQGAEKKSQ